MDDIVNGNIVGVEINENGSLIYCADDSFPEGGFTFNSKMILQRDIDYAGMFLQVRIENTPMHYTYKEWISAELI